MSDKRTGYEVAVIGMAGKFAGADSIEAYWNNLINGVESVTVFSDEDLAEAGVEPEIYKSENYIRSKGLLKGAEYFDADFFDYKYDEAKIMDPQVRLLHELRSGK